MLYVVTEW